MRRELRCRFAGRLLLLVLLLLLLLLVLLLLLLLLLLFVAAAVAAVVAAVCCCCCVSQTAPNADGAPTPVGQTAPNADGTPHLQVKRHPMPTKPHTHTCRSNGTQCRRNRSNSTPRARFITAVPPQTIVQNVIFKTSQPSWNEHAPRETYHSKDNHGTSHGNHVH